MTPQETQDYINALPLTKASFLIDGNLRLETAIPGYRTISADGRDSMELEIDELESKIVDGAYFRGTRVPSRDITVSFVLIRSNVESLHAAYNMLRDYLYNRDYSTFEFEDEPDVFYVGTPQNLTSENIVLQNDSQGTFTIHCSEPFKYGKDFIEVFPDQDDPTQFTIDYTGSYKSYPILEASFSNDCGYIGFADDVAALQFGNPNEDNVGYVQTNKKVNILQYSKGTSLTASSFTNNSAFIKSNSSGGSAVLIPLGINQKGTLIHDEIEKRNVPTYDSKGNIVSTKTYSEKVVKVNSYGSASSSSIWAGGSFKRNFNPYNGDDTATDFFVVFQIAMDALKAGVDQRTSKDTDPRQVGMMQFVVADTLNRPLLGMVFIKNNQSTSCEIRLYAGTKELTTDRVDGEKNKNLNVYANSKQNKYLFWDHGEFSMSRIGDKVDFYVDHKHHTFSIKSTPALREAFNTQDPNPENHAVAQSINGFIGRLDTTGVSGTYGATYNPLREMYFRGFAAEKYNATEIDDIPNVFMNGDVLEVDTGSGNVRLNGILRNDLGAIGNEWDDFYLVPGAINVIKIAKSGWATQPTCKLRYRKVYV